MTRLLPLLALCSLLCGLALWFGFTVGYSRGPSDFTQDYASGIALQHGLSIYGESIESIARNMLGFTGHFNFHPPTNAVYFWPFSLLPYEAAFILWNTLNLALYILIIDLTRSALGLKMPLWQLAGFGVVWWPFIHAAALGQSSPIIAACIVGGWALLRRDRGLTGGALLGFAATIKLFPGFLGFYPLLRRQVHTVGAMIAAFAAPVILSFFIVGPADFLRYATTIMPQDVRDWGGFPLNFSVTGLLMPLLTPTEFIKPLAQWSYEQALGLSYAVSALAAFLSLAAAQRRLRAGAADEAFFVLILGMLIVSPISWGHMFPVLIPVIAYLLQQTHAPLRRGLLFLAIFFISEPNIYTARALVSAYAPNLIPGEIYLAMRAGTYGLYMLLFLLAVPERAAAGEKSRRAAAASLPNAALR